VTNYMVKSWNPAPALAGFALQIRQNPAPVGFLKSKSGTALFF